MRKIKGLFLIGIMSLSLGISAQNKKTDANIIGHVVSKGEHLPFATVLVEGTAFGTATDATGHFRFLNLPEGTHKIKAQAVGYKSQVKSVEVVSGKTIELNFDLEEDLIGLEQVVISANRNQQNRKEAMTLVNTISPEIFATTQSTSLGEGLNFTPGLRLEYNCQNCGFSQVRMNGMEGPYSQVLINDRAIFSGLAGVYGLELFPASMIDRVEVVRGGGSALYGSNAIAGTINLITKDPISSGFEIGMNTGLVGLGIEGSGAPATDNNINFNGTVVSDDGKAGVAVFGFVRDRKPFDANGDDFSELSLIKNTTVGARAYHRTGHRGKITFDYFNIRENRRGGNKYDLPNHEADISEALNHNINTAALSFDQLFKGRDKLSVYGSAQHVDRDAYYGAEQDVTAYGNSKDLSYSAGVQLFLDKEKLLFFPGNLVTGIESNGGSLVDKKLGYYDLETDTHVPNKTISDQCLFTNGAFAQAEWQIFDLKVSLGGRFDNYLVRDDTKNAKNKTGNVFSPRASLKYDVNDNFRIRTSYSHGYRAPQIFDEDLHIESSGNYKVLHSNSKDLKREDSRSFMASLDFDFMAGSTQSQILVEGFYTELINPFSNSREFNADSTIMNVIRENATEGASVYGVNVEYSFVPASNLFFKLGYTYQISEFKKAQEVFDESGIFEKKFLRTPNSYGFATLDYDFLPKFCLSLSGTYTGDMLIGYGESEIRTTKSFFDMGTKLSYDIPINGTTMQLNLGVKNIFNSYQNDFDKGVERDPAYIYGPGAPRTIYFGIKFGNFL